MLVTDRLVLKPATVDLARSEVSNLAALWIRLGAVEPGVWPPPLNDKESLGWMVDYLESDPAAQGWALWYFLEPQEGRGLVPIGNGGFKGRPSEDGIVEIGYSIVQEHQRRGLATEAVKSLLDWAFSFQEVSCIIAHTFPELQASIRVLEKCGFSFAGPGEKETGRIVYELRRTTT